MPAELSLEAFAADALDWPAVREVLARHAPSALARRALHELAPRPDDEARDALARCAEALAARERPPIGGHPDPLPGLEDARVYARSLSGEDLAAVARLCRTLDACAVWLAARRHELPRCEALLAGRPDLDELRAALDRAVDERGEVRDDASPLLARLRREAARLEEEVDRRVRRLAGAAELRAALAEGHAGQVHRRGGRPVLAVRARSRGRVPGLVHDRSQTGETLFVEPQEVVEPGNRLAAARSDAEREVARLLVELTRAVLRRLEALRAASARLADLELAFLGAAWARECGGRPARLPDEGEHEVLLLRDVRHPLLVEEERLGRLERAVPLDLRLGAEFDLLVVTGPNTGGKTLAVETAGLAVLLTRLGLPLPSAEGTTVALLDGVFADIGDEQEIQQSLSTFSSHLVRIRAALVGATPRTLVLLDELGGGTDPAEGAALGEAILEALLERGVPTLATTHLGKLKEFAFRHARVENASVEFDPVTLAPRYRLLVGAPGESRALAIARRIGLPPEVLARAAERVEERPEETTRLMEDLRVSRVDAERMRRDAEDRLAELGGRLAALEEERDRLAARGEQLEAEAQRGIEERVARARTWLERARGALEQVPRGPREALSEALDELAGALGEAELSERRVAFLRGLRKGDFVWLPRWRKRARVERVRKAREEVVVRLGRNEMTVPFRDVTFYESL